MTARSSFPALGTTAVVAVSEPEALDEAHAILARELVRTDLTCSRFRADSELARVNRADGAPVDVSPRLHDELQAALAAAAETDGLVDPTLGAELRAAGYDRTFALVRARDGWHVEARAKPQAVWRRIELETTRVRVPPGVELDLGATAKARAADLAAGHIAERTRCGVLVSLGGDIAVSGPPPPGGWTILVSDVHDAPLDGPGPRISIRTGGLATSSTAVRRWETDDGERHHVLDPRTGTSAETPWRTVTVAARTCLDANVASIAALVLGRDAPAWLEARGLPSRLVAPGGAVAFTAGWPVEAA